MILAQNTQAQLHLLGPGVTGSDVNNRGLVRATADNVRSLYWTQESGLQEISVLSTNYFYHRKRYNNQP